MRLPSHSTFIAIGHPQQKLFYLLKGSVLLHIRSPSGRQLTLEVLRPGRLFGLPALLPESIHRLDGTTLTRCDLLELSRETFIDSLLDDPKLGIETLYAAVRGLTQRTRQLEDMALADLEARIASWVLQTFAERNVAVENGASVRLDLPQSNIASMIGISRETLNRQLNCWRAQNVIAISGMQLLILDANRLRRLQPG